ncbi:MAG TPA: FHA domain-containing protein [Solirubrobacteraceae bacterium]|nr:FHA domain-containing protein [Solirubrobacteraceae bacterium]
MGELVLRVLEGNAKGTELRVVDELLLGRSAGRPGNLENDPTLSRRHARLRPTADDLLLLEDLGSHNGTYVNGRLVRTPVTLARGDRIEIGQTTLELVVLADPLPPEAEVTRYARPVPGPPAAAPVDPQVTRLAPAGEPPPAAAPVAPQVTRLAPAGEPPPVDPQTTRLARVAEEPPPPPPVDPQTTRLARVAEEPPPPPAVDPQVTRLAEVPAPVAPQVTRLARAAEEVGGQPTRLAQVPVEPAPGAAADQAGEPEPEAEAEPAPAARRPWWKRLLRR